MAHLTENIASALTGQLSQASISQDESDAKPNAAQDVHQEAPSTPTQFHEDTLISESSVYKPLGIDEIRLVRLHPGQWDDTISCELQQWPSSDCPSYYCVSYAWGSLTTMIPILLNEQEICVGAGLYEALRRFREILRTNDQTSDGPFPTKTYEALWIWADSLCLDQKNEKEKEKHIPKMGTIYGRAERVLAWLGENQKEDESSVQLLMRICKIEATAEGPWQDGPYRQSLYTAIGERMKEFVGIVSTVLVRPFFLRLWIVQEMALANHDPIMLAGQHFCDLTSLNRMLDFVLHTRLVTRFPFHFTTDHFHIRAFMQLRTLYKDCPPVPHETNDPIFAGWRLNRYLRALRGTFMASRPHDLLYGMLGIAGARELPPALRPDYSRPFEEVYKDYTKLCLEECGDLSLLDRIWSNLKNVPSWVPDYRQHPWSLTHDNWPGLEFLPGDRLLVHGIKLDACINVWNPPEDAESEVDEAWHENVLKSLHTFFNAVAGAAGVAVETIIQSWLDVSFRVIGMHDAADSPKSFIYDSVMAGAYLNRAQWNVDSGSARFALTGPLVATERGLVDRLIRKDVKAEVGDYLCAIQGSRLPILLRPRSDTEFVFLGMCHRWVDGSVLEFKREFFEGQELRSFEIL